MHLAVTCVYVGGGERWRNLGMRALYTVGIRFNSTHELKSTSSWQQAATSPRHHDRSSECKIQSTLTNSDKSPSFRFSKWFKTMQSKRLVYGPVDWSIISHRGRPRIQTDRVTGGQADLWTYVKITQHQKNVSEILNEWITCRKDFVSTRVRTSQIKSGFPRWLTSKWEQGVSESYTAHIWYTSIHVYTWSDRRADRNYTRFTFHQVIYKTSIRPSL
jgi:hypothetical protein